MGEDMKLDTTQSTFYSLSEEKVVEFIEYRKAIKKPIKTQGGLNQTMKNAMLAANKYGFEADYAIDLIKNAEWQGVTLPNIELALKNIGAQSVASTGLRERTLIEDLHDRSWAD